MENEDFLSLHNVIYLKYLVLIAMLPGTYRLIHLTDGLIQNT